MANVRGAGPLTITTVNAQHRTIPLGALTYDGTNFSFVGGPDDEAERKAALLWAEYLKKEGNLQIAGSGPAFLVTAAHPGTSGNAIKLDLSNVNVTEGKPPSATTLDVTVTVTNTYVGLSLATVADVIGASVDGGEKPGLIHLASKPPLDKMPDAQTASFKLAGAIMQAEVKKDGETAFLLEAPGDVGGADKFDVTVANVAASKFDLVVTWKKTVAGETLDKHVAAFAYVLAITKPPEGFGNPAAGQITLQDGADPIPVTPATPAKAVGPAA